jgi:hypothetical protein
MSAVEDGHAVLLRVGTRKADILRALFAMKGVYRVERIQGLYDIVVHVAGREHDEAIEKHARIIGAEICGVSARHGIASDAHATRGEGRPSGAPHPERPRSSSTRGNGFANRLRGFNDQ